mgnify:CR=1 FL=1
MFSEANQKKKQSGQNKISELQVFEKFEQVQNKKRQPFLMHRPDIRAERVVNMKRRKSENYAGNESGRFACPAPKINFAGIIIVQ